MNVANAAMDFKRAHPHNYWVRIVCLAFCLVFLGLWTLADDVDGAPTQHTLQSTDNSNPAAAANDRGTHMKNDTVVVATSPGGDSLVLTYKESGEDWVNVTIHDSGTANYYVAAGVINTDNNTLVVLTSLRTATYSDTYIFIKWPGSDWDTWHEVKIGGNRFAADLSVNDTGVIAILSTYTTATFNIVFWYYDLEALTRDPDTDNGASTAKATTDFRTVQVLCNSSGQFFFTWLNAATHYAMKLLSGSSYALYASQYYVSVVVMLSNDRMWGVGQYQHTGRPYALYQTTEDQGYPWERTYLEQSGSGDTYEWEGISVSVKQDSLFLDILTYCNVHEEFVHWSGSWDSSELTWDGLKSHTGNGDSDDVAMYGNFGALWPMHESTGIRWTRPSGGYAFMGRDESGATDTLDYIYDGVTWTADLTTGDPVITTASLPDAIYDEFYEHTLAKSNGTIPFVWTVLIKPDWMSIGAVNGTIYGTPDGTGTEEVRVKLADAVPRYDEKQWTLTIGTGTEGEGDEADGPICASSWMVFAVIIVIIIVMVGWAADTMF